MNKASRPGKRSGRALATMPANGGEYEGSSSAKASSEHITHAILDERLLLVSRQAV